MTTNGAGVTGPFIRPTIKENAMTYFINNDDKILAWLSFRLVSFRDKLLGTWRDRDLKKIHTLYLKKYIHLCIFQEICSPATSRNIHPCITCEASCVNCSTCFVFSAMLPRMEDRLTTKLSYRWFYQLFEVTKIFCTIIFSQGWQSETGQKRNKCIENP